MAAAAPAAGAAEPPAPGRSPRTSPLLVAAIAAVVALALLHSGELRGRAEAGLGRGMPAREAALARGFVLGEDELIDPRTRQDFRRSGLSHLLAVSGQNVVLLGLGATPLLALLGLGLRERILWLLGLIAVYVPLAGAGPSIQRAAVMGAAGLVATLAGRPASRIFGLLVALVVTLAIAPGVAADPGWQLSFAAVAGIFALARPLRGRLGAGGGHWRRALAEAAAVSVAATLATAPLIAFHFGTVSTTTLAANLLALPAVAPAMWLGMASAALAQVPGAPLELPNALNAHLLAYIAQVAAWCGRPAWAELRVGIGGAGLAVSYLALLAFAVALHLWDRAHPPSARSRRPRRHRVGGPRGARTAAVAATACAAAALWLGPGALGGAGRVALGGAEGLLRSLLVGSPAAPLAPGRGLRIRVLDVGQGDAILLAPAGAAPILVDAGPPRGGLLGGLAAAGVRRLGAVVITHPEADHIGGLSELLGSVAVGRLLYARLPPGLRAAARGAGAVPGRIAAGRTVRSGRLSLRVLWPPPALLTAPAAGADPNSQALVLLARWGRFSMLLCADAEAEAVPLDPGGIDVLKVAHHGSEDAGLGALVDRARPRLAVISVGAGNPFGHPTPATLAVLSSRSVPVLRTDRDGTVEIDVRAGRMRVWLP